MYSLIVQGIIQDLTKLDGRQIPKVTIAYVVMGGKTLVVKGCWIVNDVSFPVYIRKHLIDRYWSLGDLPFKRFLEIFNFPQQTAVIMLN